MMKKLYPVLMVIVGIAFYAGGLVLLAKLQYDAAAGCLLAASVLILAAAVIGIVRWVKKRKR